MTEQNPRHASDWLCGAEAAKLTKWLASLDENRGHRARLRRVVSPEDALLTDAFAHFLEFVPQNWRENHNILRSALVACVLAHIKETRSDKSFAAQLGTVEGEKPVMSELRFRQLLKSQTLDEFYIRVLRAIRLLKGSVNMISITSGILQWYGEHQFGTEQNPVNRLSVKWARDYYIPPKQQIEAEGNPS